MVDVENMEAHERLSPNKSNQDNKVREQRRLHVEKERTKVNSINTSMLSDDPSTQPNN